MREIKFRYKVKDSNKLIYDSDKSFGYLANKRKVIACSNGGMFFVEHEMQYANLNDKNNKKIYDGDILYISGWHGLRVIINGHDPYPDKRIVGWNYKYPGWNLYQLDHSEQLHGTIFCVNNQKNVRVIGNIHENPELLKKGR